LPDGGEVLAEWFPVGVALAADGGSVEADLVGELRVPDFSLGEIVGSIYGLA
jgi:hypothetical protein